MLIICISICIIVFWETIASLCNFLYFFPIIIFNSTCKKESKYENIRKNFIFEKFKDQLILEKEQESEINFKAKFYKLNKEIAEKQISNFYQVFFKGLKTIFNSYESFFEEFNNESNKRIRSLLDSNENINSDGSRKYTLNNLDESKIIYY